MFSAPQLPCTSATQYRALLAQVEQRSEQPEVSLPELADTVPAYCDFIVAGRAFHLSNFKMQRELRQIAAKPEDRIARLQSFQHGLQQRRGGIDAYERPSDPTATPKLQEIMRRREFRRVGGQDPAQIFQEWALMVLEKIFSRIFKDPARVVSGAKILGWSLCIAVGGFVCWKLYRWAMRERPLEAVREVIPFAPSSKSWRGWLAEARTAEAQGDLRAAVHAGYWAAISQLESSGAWRPDRARTPREYLRLITQTDPARPLLIEITRHFEVVWYGNRPPAFTEWESFLAKVERIGCR